MGAYRSRSGNEGLLRRLEEMNVAAAASSSSRPASAASSNPNMEKTLRLVSSSLFAVLDTIV